MGRKTYFNKVFLSLTYFAILFLIVLAFISNATAQIFYGSQYSGYPNYYTQFYGPFSSSSTGSTCSLACGGTYLTCWPVFCSITSPYSLYGGLTTPLDMTVFGIGNTSQIYSPTIPTCWPIFCSSFTSQIYSPTIPTCWPIFCSSLTSQIYSPTIPTCWPIFCGWDLLNSQELMYPNPINYILPSSPLIGLLGLIGSPASIPLDLRGLLGSPPSSPPAF